MWQNCLIREIIHVSANEFAVTMTTTCNINESNLEDSFHKSLAVPTSSRMPTSHGSLGILSLVQIMWMIMMNKLLLFAFDSECKGPHNMPKGKMFQNSHVSNKKKEIFKCVI